MPQAHASASSKPAPAAPKPEPAPAPEDVAMTDEEREAAAKKAEALKEKVGLAGTPVHAQIMGMAPGVGTWSDEAYGPSDWMRLWGCMRGRVRTWRRPGYELALLGGSPSNRYIQLVGTLGTQTRHSGQLVQL